MTLTGTTTYENSIFQVSPTFNFTGNTLSTAVEGKVATLATAPSQLRVIPSVSYDATKINCDRIQLGLDLYGSLVLY